MGKSSLLGGERAAQQPAGRDTDLLGPGDSSDSGSDVQGVMDPGVDSDAVGTGERADVEGGRTHDASDIAPDHQIRGEGTPGLDEVEDLAADDDDEDEEDDEAA